ncbi:periplasmic protein involved in polysaccharide export [Burkholderiales bacterium JOSHI_001]|nr:periplasmic protein involved in polysaccharide export [Burkholderiales bacterium JOSHI_001]
MNPNLQPIGLSESGITLRHLADAGVSRVLRAARMAAWLLAAWGLAPPAAMAQANGTGAEAATAAPAGPIRLRQPDKSLGNGEPSRPGLTTKDQPQLERNSSPQRSPALSEFEEHVLKLAGTQGIQRFGMGLMATAGAGLDVQEVSPKIPDDYLLQPGDELVVTLWGSIDAELRLEIDSSGRISIPRVGTVMVAGARYGGLNELISKRVGQVFRNFQVSATLSHLRGIGVYMTGYVQRPGPLAVSSLSSIVTALVRAGGPTAAGSLRNIQLRRGRDVVATFDLYEVLLKGDRSNDRLLQAGDVIHVGAVGPQVALIGSVNQPAIFELAPGETVADLLRMAGGFAPVADRSRVSVERVEERSTVRVTELKLPADEKTRLSSGDVVRALSAVDVQVPVQLKHKRVRVEGEVLRPGEYVLSADSTIADGLQAAGGLTGSAHLFATDFSRASVRKTQQDNYERALRDLETEITRLNSTRRAVTGDEAAAQTARNSGSERLIDRLRQIKPTGRIVLELPPQVSTLPPLLLEDGDRIYIPPRSTTVGVFGSVFNAGSYLFSEGRMIEEYLRLAGGPTKGADISSAIVVRANGSVVSGKQRGGWLGSGSGLSGVRAEAGDTVFVPEELDKTTWVQGLKDWTQIFYNFGLGAAAIKSVLN